MSGFPFPPLGKVVLLALCTAPLGATATTQDTVKFAMNATYPPFEFTNEKNEIIGFDVDIANALCDKMKISCSYHNHAFDSLIPSIKLRRYDAAISGMDITAERQKQVAFSDPYYDNAAVFVSVNSVTYAQALKGKRVGVQNGTTHQKYIKDQLPGLIPVPYTNYQNAFIDMKSGRVDAVFGDTAVISEWMKKDSTLNMIGQPITHSAYFGQGFGIAVHPQNQALLKQLNTALVEIKADGTYQEIYNKWFM
ncbi:arginine ABC transporter substrate-binding protein [Photobacterium aquae]|uniref:Arginine ABC transporter substrate-binding protein n=1 Tax=Photobacterium aquae TaxID=1195763 RepID=A0A0J1H1B0_9GAMM|nr:arginine ABC transporter substrate-binding protein [Photobacterium aquae]KLV05579.1 arginine ABC transporter substrate-binding protein [Photobacterium aquae]